jgi:hypothetical protein
LRDENSKADGLKPILLFALAKRAGNLPSLDSGGNFYGQE